MRVFHMNVQGTDLYLILNGDEITTGMVDPSTEFESWALCPESAQTVHSRMNRSGRLREIHCSA